MGNDFYPPEVRQYRAFLCSVSGMYAQYEGHVDVNVKLVDIQADGEHEAVFYAAVRQLRCTSFPDRTRDAWRMEKFVPITTTWNW